MLQFLLETAGKEHCDHSLLNVTNDCAIMAAAIYDREPYHVAYGWFQIKHEEVYGRKMRWWKMPPAGWINVCISVYAEFGLTYLKLGSPLPTLSDAYKQYGNGIYYIPGHVVVIIDGVVIGDWDCRFHQRNKHGIASKKNPYREEVVQSVFHQNTDWTVT